MKFPLRRCASVFAPIVILLAVTSLFGQDLDDITVSGRVTDPNDLAIVGATIIITEQDSGAERTLTTNEEGRYRFIELKPGIYRVKVSAMGFGSQVRTDLATVAAQNLRLDFRLSPGDVKAETTVTVGDSDAPLVDTTRTIVGGTIREREIEELPNNTRNPLDLVLILGGTSEEQLSTSGLAEDRFQNPATAPLEQGNFSLSGGVAYSNNITIDGLDNNDDRSSRDRFQPSLESVVEVQVITNQFSSEYGRASGGRINLRTRSGSNRFRGRVFLFFRDNRLNANSWYNNSRGNERQPLTEYDPGFSLNGPIVLPFYNGRKRTFFSVTYEHDNVRDTTLIDTWLPRTSNPNFPLPAPTSDVCPANIASCTDGNGASIFPYTEIVKTPNIYNVLTARIDHNFSKRNNATFGYQFGRRRNQRTTFASTARLTDGLQIRNSSTDAFNFTDNHVFASNLVNQVRFQYSIYEPSFATSNPFGPVVLIGYTNPETGGSQTLIAGNSTAGITGDATGFPQNRRESRYQIQDSVTYVRGSHSFKFGFDTMKIRSRALGLGDATGTYNYTGFANFQNNVLARYRHNFGTRSDVTNTYLGVFFNDDFKVRNLTVSYGIRYERETAVSDDNNFGPRVGIAWSPFKDRKGVIRAGAGLFYNRVLLRTVADSIQNKGGNLVQFDTNLIGTSTNDPRRRSILDAIAQRFPGGFESPDGLVAMLNSVCPTVVNAPAPCTSTTGFANRTTSTGNPLRTVEPNLVIPESYQLNVGFEREIIKGWVFEANYTINKTAHLWRDINGNVPVLPAGYSNWTDWLVDHPLTITNQNGTTRTYNFYVGTSASNTNSGLSAQQNGTTVCPTSGSTSVFVTNSTCFVNLRTLNSSSATPLAASTGSNNNAVGAPIGIALAAVAKLRPDPQVDETSVIHSLGNAYYTGLILEFRRRYRELGGGFSSSFRFVYTLSKTMDDGLNNTANAEINGDFSREWARTLQDRRHRLAFSGTFGTPAWMGRLRFSPVFRYGSSAPFNLGTGQDRNLDDLSTDRPNFIGNLSDLRWREPGSTIPTDLISQFSLPVIGSRSGNLPRNAGIGPSFYTFDLSLTREWKFGERMRLRPTAQFDNILNAAVFNYGAAFINFNDLTITSSASQNAFLVPTRTFRQRQIRLGARFDF